MIQRMKNRVLLAAFAMPPFAITLAAQRPADAPATMTAAKPPDTVLIEELTWAEVRDLVAAGTTNVIVGTAGTEQKGPHMVDGEHKFVMDYAADKIARGMGKTLVAPVVTYVPEGSWDTAERPHGAIPARSRCPKIASSSCWSSPGRSLKAGGFKNICFLGESGGNRTGMRTAATQLNELWKGAATAYWVDDYYTKSHADQNKWITANMKIPEDQIGGHANLLDTSELLFVAPKHVRRDRLTGNDYPNNGVSGDPAKSTPEIGKVFLQIKIDNALAQIKRMIERQRAAGGRAAGAAVAAVVAAAARVVRRMRRRRPTGPTMDDRAGEQDADQGARHRVHRRADVGREPRRDEGGQDRVHRPDRRHREERLPHGARQA